MNHTLLETKNDFFLKKKKKKAAKVIGDTYMDQYVSGKLRPCASTWPQNVLGGGIQKHRNPAGVSLVHLKEGEEIEVTVGWE